MPANLRAVAAIPAATFSALLGVWLCAGCAFQTARRPAEPLTVAAVHFPEKIDALVDAGADVNAVGDEGRTPLLLAVVYQNEASVERLLARGADPNAPSGQREYPLPWAARVSNKDIVSMLLERGADPNLMTDGKAAIHWAASYGQTEVVRQLIARGADVNLVAEHTGYTPLHEAVDFGQAEVAEVLLRAGARRDVKDSVGNTPLDLNLVGTDLRTREVLERGSGG